MGVEEKKKVIVIGAGLVGTNLAYYLADSDRFDVSVYEKESENAAKTSYANAGHRGSNT